MIETRKDALTAPSRTALIGAALAAAAVLACLEAAQVWLFTRQYRNGVPLSEAVLSTLPSWVILALLLAPAALLFTRFPLDRKRLLVSIPVHLCAAALFTAVHLAGTALFAEMLLRPIGLWARLAELATHYFTLDVLTYLAIVGVFQLVRVYRAEVRHERAAADLSASLSHVRFHALRNQLDPHFIFNALNAINSLALRGNRDELVQTVTSLAALLRESLRESTPQMVPLAVELQYVSNYLALQTIRFPNRLRIETIVSGEAGRALVPALTVHSLVEEAVTTRMRGSEPCSVRLLGARDEDSLHVDVMLDGRVEGDGTDLDIPISALDSRLRRLYGTGYGLTHDRTQDHTAIRLRIPARTSHS